MATIILMVMDVEFDAKSIYEKIEAISRFRYSIRRNFSVRVYQRKRKHKHKHKHKQYGDARRWRGKRLRCARCSISKLSIRNPTLLTIAS